MTDNPPSLAVLIGAVSAVLMAYDSGKLNAGRWESTTYEGPVRIKVEVDVPKEAGVSVASDPVEPRMTDDRTPWAVFRADLLRENRIYVLLARLTELAAEGKGMDVEEVRFLHDMLPLHPNAAVEEGKRRLRENGLDAQGMPVGLYARFAFAMGITPEALVPLLMRLLDAGLEIKRCAT